MTEKKNANANAKLYKLTTDHPRLELGKLYQPGDVVDLSHLPQDQIAFLVTRGMYTEVKNA